MNYRCHVPDFKDLCVCAENVPRRGVELDVLDRLAVLVVLDNGGPFDNNLNK